MSKPAEEFFKNLSLPVLVKDETKKRAFTRSLEIIGEAAKKIPKAMAGMRDKLIHWYFGVDWEIVWDVVTNEIPKLRKQVKNLVGGI